MSAVASEGKGEATAAPADDGGRPPMPPGAAGPAGEQPGPQVESQGDRFETLMEYDPKAKLPLPIALVWICAFIGLGAYAVTLYFPEFARWGNP